MSAQLKKGVLDMVILSYINTNDSYGYDIYQYVNNRLGISESTVYPILRKYVKEDLCETYLKESSEGPARKYFRITSIGKEKLDKIIDTYDFFTKKVEYIMKELGGKNNEK